MSIDAIPAWLFFAGTAIAVMISIEAGYLLGRAVHRKSEDEKEAPVSAIAASILGLAAFILAFTFGLVSDRYDARKGLVREEANAIRTAYRRADFLPEPDRAEAKGLLRKYVNVRLTFVQSGNFEPEHVNRFFALVDRTQVRLWDMAVANARRDMNSDVAALYIEALNEVIGIHALRVATIQARVPGEIWLVLYGITILGMTGIGYQTGIAGSKRSMARSILALSFAMVFTLIALLDHPASDFFKVTQQPLVDLLNSMETHAPAGGRQLSPPPSR